MSMASYMNSSMLASAANEDTAQDAYNTKKCPERKKKKSSQSHPVEYGLLLKQLEEKDKKIKEMEKMLAEMGKKK